MTPIAKYLARRRFPGSVALMLALVAGVATGAGAADKAVVNAGVDFYSRYVWRGSDIGDSPSIEPALSVDWYGFELGAWGAYSTARESASHDEIDFWLSHSTEFENGAALTLVVTDYTYPNAGIRFSKSDAHLLETGLSVTGPKGFPLTVSAYVNVSNDDGHNTYFQLGCPASARDVDLQFFLGVAGGSKKNPGYYGTDTVNAINAGVSATRKIAVTDTFSLPLTGALIYNPRVEVTYLVVGVGF
jgi:Bacterial protein of unknown function (Gcw_chp)